MAETLADRLRRARKHAGIPARELDRVAGLAEGHTSLIESGARGNVAIHTAMKLATALGVSLDWLIAGRGGAPSARTVRSAVDARTGTES